MCVDLDVFFEYLCSECQVFVYIFDGYCCDLLKIFVFVEKVGFFDWNVFDICSLCIFVVCLYQQG